MSASLHDFWRGELVRLRGIEPDDAAFFFVWNDTEMARGLDEVWSPSSLAGVQAWGGCGA